MAPFVITTPSASTLRDLITASANQAISEQVVMRRIVLVRVHLVVDKAGRIV